MAKRKKQFNPPPKETFAFASDDEPVDKDSDFSSSDDDELSSNHEDLGSVNEALSSEEEDLPLESSEEDESDDLEDEDENEAEDDLEDLEEEDGEDEYATGNARGKSENIEIGEAYSDEDEVVLPSRQPMQKADFDGDGNKDSDIEESPDDYLPDAKAWGKKKSIYFGTDYVDKDFRKTRQDEEDLAQAEEEEAKAIQKRLLNELNEADLELNRIVKHLEDQNQRSVEKVEVDYESLSKREKLELVKKEFPELISLVEDFKSTLAEIDRLKNLLNYKNVDNLQSYKSSPVLKLCAKKYFLLQRYCMNISYYLLLKSSKRPVHNHPVISNLITFKKMIAEIEKIEKKKAFRLTLAEYRKKVFANELIQLDKQSSEGQSESEVDLRDLDEEPEIKTPRKRKIRFQDEVEDEPLNTEEDIYKDYGDLREEDEGPVDGDLDSEELEDEDEDEDEDEKELDLDQQGGEDGGDEDDLRRPINYQIEKNKGLTPKKRKDQRNPRVKHRKKFKRAQARRRGQVREPRKETSKYSGEFTGIKSGTVRSIKFK